MKQKSIRTTVDIPAHLYRNLKESAAAKGISVRKLILEGVRTVLVEGQRPHSRKVKFPFIVSKGPKVNITNDQVYEDIEFP